MGDKGTFWLPEGASTLASEIDWLFNFVHIVSLILFIGVVGGIILFAFKYRRRRADEVPVPVTESKFLEMAWIIVPTILVLVLFNWGFQTFIKIQVAPPDSYEINVIARKWLWEFQYPDGTTSTNELHVPANRPVRLVMQSEDVIHSLFVPAFRIKQDVLPNRYTAVWFETTRAGEFQLFCTEYCGTQHSGMLAKVVAHPQGEFEQWLESAGGDDDLPLPELGARLYEQQVCKTCHSIDGSRVIGPTFKGLFGSTRQLEGGGTAVADEDYLLEAIVEPSAKVTAGYPNAMPPSYAGLSARQLDALIAFIKEQQ